ncbi:MAG TPA: putative zinc-binding peptidase [Stellaceae bacterium]|jgi:hypothetical protein
MKLFTCEWCGQLLYFENVRCERCGHRLGYVPDAGTLSALEEAAETAGEWHPVGAPGRLLRFCANAGFAACNWLVPASSPERYCTACRHNRTVPDLSQPGNLSAWQRIELAKHRLFYTLLRLRLPLENRADNSQEGLAFDFLADPPAPGNGPQVMTGHDNGLITLALAEADDAERERRRTGMGEPYRTLLGHFRHEVGHWYWDRLVRDGAPWTLDACRALFGDDRRDYGEALQTHYANGAPPDWQEHFVSAYASSHPWEDFAETWAHYLHIVDTLEMADAFGVRVHPRAAGDGVPAATVHVDPYAAGQGIERIVEAWLPLVFALNNLSRCIGAGDLYPFILSPAAIRKLGFIHELVQAAGAAADDGSLAPRREGRARSRAAGG